MSFVPTELRYLSVCAGIEAVTAACHDLGWRPQMFSEIAPFPRQVLRHHYQAVPLVGDFTALILNPPPDIDVLVGGTPCQAFSVAGKRLSLEDYRGNLSLAFVDLAHALDAVSGGVRWVEWENVPGVLSTPDNAFGCFLGRLVGADAPLTPLKGRGWTDAGVVSGPKRTAAWRVLDAQYFGLAQRRERIFVLSSRGAGNYACAAALFPVGEGLSRHPAPRREARQGVAADAQGGTRSGGATRQIAPTLPARARAGGGMGTDFDCDGGLVLHAPEVSPALKARDYKGVSSDGDGDGDGDGAPLVVTSLTGDLAHALKADGFDGSEDGTGRGVPIISALSHHIVMRQREGKPGGGKGPLLSDNLSLTLAANTNDQVIFPPAVIAFSCRDDGQGATEDLSPTLRAMGNVKGNPNAGGQIAVAFPLQDPERGRKKQNGLGVGSDDDPSFTLQAGHVQGVAAFDPRNITSKANRTRVENGLPVPTLHAQPMNVIAGHPRRLTTVECERLQGFPDEYTMIPLPQLKSGKMRWRKVSEDEAIYLERHGAPIERRVGKKGKHLGIVAYFTSVCADGPRYKALGNAMARNVMRWLGMRINLVEVTGEFFTEVL